MRKFINWLFGAAEPTYTLLIVDWGTGYAKYYRKCKLERVYKLGSRQGIELEHDTVVEYKA